jgi:hypothetical protein
MVFEKERPEVMARRQAERERQTREAETAARHAKAQQRLTLPRRRESRVAKASLRSSEPAPISTKMGPVQEPTDSLTIPPLVNYDDPDALKRAILHYEILGRPVALRDPFERTAEY